MGKHNLIFYPSQWAALQQLDDQQLGSVMRQALDYAFNGIEPDSKEIAFMFLKAQIDIDADKYEEKCKKSIEAAQKRWQRDNAEGCERIPTDANASERIPTDANYAKDKDKDKDKDKHKDNHKDKDKDNYDFAADLLANGVPENYVNDFLQVRKKKRASNTRSAMEGLKNNAAKAGISLAYAVQLCAQHSWQSFDPKYVEGWRLDDKYKKNDADQTPITQRLDQFGQPIVDVDLN